MEELEMELALVLSERQEIFVKIVLLDITELTVMFVLIVTMVLVMKERVEMEIVLARLNIMVQDVIYVL